jgi:hypothetical protein
MPFFKTRIICPYCLAEIRGGYKKESCPVCKKELPVQYVHDYETCQPFFVQVFGWSKVGKTMFLSALTSVLMKMSKIWPEYYCAAVSAVSQSKVQEINDYHARGQMPTPTQLDGNEVYIMLLKNMELWGSRALVTRDCAGETFENFKVPVEEAPFLLNAPTTFMFISLPDLPNSGGRSMNMLLENYVNTLMKYGINFDTEKRKLVVVFTKADLIENLPANLRNYLISDPIWAAINSSQEVPQMDAVEMQEYLEAMGRVSDALRDWIQREASGQVFVRFAVSKNIDVRFSLISSTGSPVDNNATMKEALAPRRVLDPYFWALELQSRADSGNI